MATSLVIVGVGGQGVLTLARWIGEAALAEGYDVRIAEVHGMSQRGGSVEVHVRYGKDIYAPIVEEGGADYVIALEALEALRAYKYLKRGGELIVNKRVIQPPGNWLEEEEIFKAILTSGVKSYIVPCFDIAIELGSPLYENAVMLGFFSQLAGLPMPPSLDERNREAFRRGALVYNSLAPY
ncbi:indolepyruvate oxidoreductase subunit beta [Pyrobaculum aerophilum]|uniref:indolepyruvate oxidoreductase subunit beta n=1 Tax=Pyrobaculum aerophilum TaxID=13773 RepID=UPI002FDAD397